MTERTYRNGRKTYRKRPKTYQNRANEACPHHQWRSHSHGGACFFKGGGGALNPAQTLFFARAFFSIYGTLGNSTPLNNISQNAECANMLMC
nr:MAG TPA: hypothetical protein [Caudoviricetes sp.]